MGAHASTVTGRVRTGLGWRLAACCWIGVTWIGRFLYALAWLGWQVLRVVVLLTMGLFLLAG